jgi:transglutaminase-like putative cysteine protease
MRLTIFHTTTYRYASDVAFQPHRIMLRPRGSQDIQVLDYTLRCSPEAQVEWTQDVFGNLVATAAFDEPSNELEVFSRLVVETSAGAWPVFPIAPHAHSYPFAYSPDERVDLGAYLTPEHPDPAVEAWARAVVYCDPTDTLSLLKDVSFAVLSAAAYRPRDEEGTQTAAETLQLASGSCRDLAALFIDAVRALGFGARAASGYLYDTTAAGGDSDTTHAWAEVYLPGAGWITFDPTHGRIGDAGLVATAIARTSSQIMPIAGAYVGRPEEFEDMTVDIHMVAHG